ncbi:MAG: hypothetical protein ABSF52_10025 [Syntrophobacteraceae bacterium]|jgi:hypothetical protein
MLNDITIHYISIGKNISYFVYLPGHIREVKFLTAKTAFYRFELDGLGANRAFLYILVTANGVGPR